uniref:hypothetical protein n=1 Tax=Nocardia farcinica TaxID=37329 RepID=UPI003CC7E345
MPDPLAPSSNRLRWEHAALVDLDRACAGLLEALTAAHDQARALAERPHWGLGEADPALHSAAALAELFREKASDTPGGVGGALAGATAGGAGYSRRITPRSRWCWRSWSRICGAPTPPRAAERRPALGDQGRATRVTVVPGSTLL